MMKFTKEALAALTLPPGKADHIEWDEALPGFGVRLRGRTKHWVVQYRAGTHQRRESLGDARKVGLEDARKVARQRFAQVELGGDPAADRVRARARALTLGVVIGRYLEAKRDRLRTNTFKAATRYFAVHWRPLHDRPLDAIVRAEVAARLQELIKAHGRTSAARARSNLSALYGWAMKEGLCEANPVMATNDPTEGIQSRDRVLSDDEIRIIWNACGDDAAGRVTKLLLLTGCRREEIGALRWSEIEAGVLTIPGTRTKNGRGARAGTARRCNRAARRSAEAERRRFCFRPGRRYAVQRMVCGEAAARCPHRHDQRQAACAMDVARFTQDYAQRARHARRSAARGRACDQSRQGWRRSDL